MNLSSGDSDDTFSVQGSGFAPRAPVTVSLDWQSPPQLNQSFRHTSPIKPVVSRNGTFRFTVNQLNPGPLPLGQYDVVVTAPSGQKRSTQFVVLPGDGLADTRPQSWVHQRSSCRDRQAGSFTRPRSTVVMMP